MTVTGIFTWAPLFQVLALASFFTILGAAVYFLSLATLKAIKKSDVEQVRDYLPSRLKWVSSWLDRMTVAG